MQANYVQRLRLTFSKRGPTRFIGHLDLALTLERSLNRARIPVAYTQGFNKRPRMQMASALPLGYTSDYELADIWLMEQMDTEAAREQMMSRMAPGLEILQAAEVDLQAPALQTITLASYYRATPLDPVNAAELQSRIDALLAAERHMRQRLRGKKKKPYDLRPLIYELTLERGDQVDHLLMKLALEPSKTGRPDEVLDSLGLDPLAARLHRTRIVLDESG
ncbi:MAG: TIGR03936 family radical SAM-associated protein [Chloroflexota bacterium]|jgi:radical SAM-linked protein